MVSLDISRQEVESSILSPEHLRAAVQAVREEGFVVLNNVIDLAHIDVLCEKMLADVESVVKREDTPFNFVTGHIQQDPPPFPPYLFRDVLMNDMAVAVTKAILGPGVQNNYYSGNTNLPGSPTQPVHVDTGQLWADLEVAPPAHSLVVNVPVVDMDATNGSTQLWPGTHLDVSKSVYDSTIKVASEALEKRRAVAPPLQPSVKAGSLLIRDIRLWHAGMPNHSDRPRPMIAMIHWCRWWHEQEKITFPKGTEDFFRHPDLKTRAEFVDGPIDYIRKPQAYDYQKAEQK